MIFYYLQTQAKPNIRMNVHPNRFFIRTSVMVALVHKYNLLCTLNEQQTILLFLHFLVKIWKVSKLWVLWGGSLHPLPPCIRPWGRQKFGFYLLNWKNKRILKMFTPDLSHVNSVSLISWSCYHRYNHRPLNPIQRWNKKTERTQVLMVEIKLKYILFFY